MKRVLVIAPHPDDEVLGCGGTIAGHVAAGDEVHLCVVTRAYPPEWTEEVIRIKRQEVNEASGILGIKETSFLDLPTVKLDTLPQKELNNAIARVVDAVKPDVVYLPHKGDLNRDHRLVFEAALVALRPLEGNTVSRILCYETLSETEWGIPDVESVFIPNVYLDIANTLETKLAAMSAYASELKEYPHPRSLEMLKVLAQKRGSEAGIAAAEAFMLVREIMR
ncbi:MAG: PIG-L family deacetylase [Chloroflexi bacterium]|nr:PIG-L family deacetylase [Chloroflexota bacterium]